MKANTKYLFLLYLSLFSVIGYRYFSFPLAIIPIAIFGIVNGYMFSDLIILNKKLEIMEKYKEMIQDE